MCAFISLHACLSHTFCPYLPTASDRFVWALYKLKGWALCQMLCKSLPSLSRVFIFYFPEKSFNLQLKSNLCIFFPYGINLCIFFFLRYPVLWCIPKVPPCSKITKAKKCTSVFFYCFCGLIFFSCCAFRSLIHLELVWVSGKSL